MKNYKYTQFWFVGSEINRRLAEFLNYNAMNHILEIGCFEGLSSVFFADNFLTHPNSTLTCVDPFLTIDNNDHQGYIIPNVVEQNFDYNISICDNSDKIDVHKITSDAFFLQPSRMSYNFIYIDGCHQPDYIERDIINAFKVIDKHGIIWMDDYLGGDGITIKNTINKTLQNYQYEIVHCGYQIAIRANL